VLIGDRLRVLREQRNFSQGEIGKRTGLLRGYISRVENGRDVPGVWTLKKFAQALDIPMYQLFYVGKEPPELPKLLKRKSRADLAWGSEGNDARMLAKFCQLFSRMKEDDLRLLFRLAEKVVGRAVFIGDRLRELREQKNFSRGEIEKRTGLRRNYVSRVENGHTVPAVETLKKFAHALEVPLYQFFYVPEELAKLLKRKSRPDIAWRSEDNDARMLAKFCQIFRCMKKNDVRLLYRFAEKVVGPDNTVPLNRGSDTHGSQATSLS
jgi:transcriptional regulator with XRE-family HTH domain